MKRMGEEVQEEQEEQEESVDVGSESVYPGSLKASPLPQRMARRKRRGVVEKRRRDRINRSLAELRRLVPAARGQQRGSARREKAEILQMTVEHLKVLQVAAGNGQPDGPALALDFLCVGFRECVSEVSRSLGQLEAAAPLWSRLLSHLTSCVSRLDASAASAAVAALTLRRPFQQQPDQVAPPLLPDQWAARLRPLPAAYGLSVRSEAGGGVASASLAPPPSILPLAPTIPLSLPGGLHLAPPPCSLTPPPSSSSSSQPSLSRAADRLWANQIGAF